MENFSYACFHSNQQILPNLEVIKCAISYYNNNWFHIISIKPIHKTQISFLTNSDRTFTRNNMKGEIDTIYEKVENIPLCVVQKLSTDCAADALRKILYQIDEYFFFLSSNSLYNRIFKTKNGIRLFCEHVACITPTLKMAFLYRFTLEQEINRKRLLQQNNLIYKVSIHFLYEKSSKKNKSYACGLNCKLKQFHPRYLNFNYENVHIIYCKLYSPSNLEQNISNFKMLYS